MRYLRSIHGISLLELLVALSVFALASLGIFAAFKSSLGGWQVSQQFASEQQNARALLELLSRQIRMIGAGYADIVTDPAIVPDRTGSSEIWFRSDMDGDGTVECRRVFLAGNVIYEQMNSSCVFTGTPPSLCSPSCRPLTSGRDAGRLDVTNLTFRYFDAATEGVTSLVTPLSTRDAYFTRRIELSVSIRGLSTPFTMTTQAVIRQ